MIGKKITLENSFIFYFKYHFAYLCMLFTFNLKNSNNVFIIINERCDKSL